jgi:hypothetical protein
LFDATAARYLSDAQRYAMRYAISVTSACLCQFDT